MPTLGRHADGVGIMTTVTRFEKALGERAQAWSGRCYEIACAIVKKRLVDGVAVYGHWLGPVHRRSPLYRERAPFSRHGWVSLEGGNVLDPTRWVFEAASPYIYIGPVGDVYDEGGNKWRRAVQPDPPPYDDSDRQYEITAQILPSAGWNFVERYLRIWQSDTQPVGFLTEPQLLYLANAPLDDLGEHAAAIYQALTKLGRRGLIPIDNYDRVERARAAPPAPAASRRGRGKQEGGSV